MRRRLNPLHQFLTWKMSVRKRPTCSATQLWACSSKGMKMIRHLTPKMVGNGFLFACLKLTTNFFLDDEEMYEGEYDDGMDYEEDMPEDDEDNVSDEDEDEGMGPIEGLSGEHGVDVEVIMEDDD